MQSCFIEADKSQSLPKCCDLSRPCAVSLCVTMYGLLLEKCSNLEASGASWHSNQRKFCNAMSQPLSMILRTHAQSLQRGLDVRRWLPVHILHETSWHLHCSTHIIGTAARVQQCAIASATALRSSACQCILL